MVNDPIGDMIIQIKNAGLAGKRNIELPYSRIKHEIANLIRSEGFIDNVDISGEVPKKTLKIKIKYFNTTPVITEVKRKSKPGMRRYVNKSSIPTVVGGMGIVILSTSKGIMSGNEAKKVGVGGELLCEIW